MARCSEVLIGALVCSSLACARAIPVEKPRRASPESTKPAARVEPTKPAEPARPRRVVASGALELARQTDVHGFARELAVHPAGRLVAFGSIGPPLTIFDTRAGKILRSFEPFGEAPSAIAISPDSNKIFATTRAGALECWDISTGARIFKTAGHEKTPASALALSADGKLAATGASGSVLLWDATKGTISARWVVESSAALAFSPDNKYLASGTEDGRVEIFELGTANRFALEGHILPVVALVFAGDRRLVSGSWDDTARIWELDTRASTIVRADVPAKEGFSLENSALSKRWRSHSRALPYRKKLVGHVERALAAYFDARTGVLTSIGDDDTLKRWNYQTGALLDSFGGDFEFGQPEQMSPDARFVLTRRSDGVRIVWDVSGKVERRVLDGRSEELNVVAFSPNADEMFAGAEDGILRVYELAGGKVIRQSRIHPKAIRAVHLASKAGLLVTRGDEGAVVVSTMALERRYELPAKPYLRASGINETHLFTADVRDVLTRWNLADGSVAGKYDGHKTTRRIFADPLGNYVATIDEGRTARIVDLRAGSLLTTIDKIAWPMEAQPIHFVGGRVFVARDGARPEVWAIAPGARAATIPGGPVAGFYSTPDILFALAENGSVNAYDLETVAPIRRFSGMPSWLEDLACTAERCASVHGDGSIRAFELAGGRLLWRKVVHRDAAIGVSISGDQVASGSWDGSVAVLDLRTGKELQRVEHRGPIEALSFETGGRSIIVGDDDGELRRWDPATGLELPSFKKLESWTAAATFSEDGCFGLSAGPGEARLFDLCGVRLVLRIPDDGVAFTAVALSKSELALGDEKGRVRVLSLDGTSRFDQKLFTRQVETLTFSPDGARLAAGETSYIDGVAIIDRELGTVENYVDRGGLGSRLVFRGRELYWVSRRGSILRWSPGQQPVELAKIEGTSHIGFPVYSLAVGASSLAVGGFSPNVELFALDGKKIAELGGHADPARVIFGSAAAPIITIDDQGRARSWSAAGKKIADLADVAERPGPPSLAVGYALLTATAGKELLLSGRWDGVLRVWDLPRKKLVSAEQESCVPIATAFLSEQKVIAAACAGGTWVMRKIGTEHVVTIDADQREWLAFTEDGFFDGSPGGAGLIALRRGDEVFGVDQLTLERNRPDLIFSRLGFGSPADIEHLARRYERRRRAASSDDLQLPEAWIESIVQDGRKIRMVVRAEDQIGLENIFVSVNGVPVHSVRVSGTQVDQSFELVVNHGISEIAASAMNQRGRESLRAVEMVRVSANTPGDLYVLAFGVSRYLDPTLVLSWADQDALDIAATLKKATGFRRIQTRVYVNEQVTPAAIAEAKSFLKDARPEDTFVLFVAGHGVTAEDADRSYWFLPHAGNLADLAGTAVPFSAFEDLLIAGAPRKRLLLLDTCESGGGDEGELLARPVEAEIVSRGFRRVRAKTPVPVLSERSRDRLIYVDLLRRSGATVLSSSRGGELSFESSSAKHGLFTAGLLLAFRRALSVDQNRDGKLEPRELLRDLAPHVARLSGGRQNPSLDRENPAEVVLFGPPIELER